VPHGFDAGARAELDERWGALRIGRLRTASARDAEISVRRDVSLPAQAYRLTVRDGRASIESSDAAGAFYAAMTLAQLPVRSEGSWSVPCVRIEDRPALQWRILSDDVSRGPLPTMRYFEERIRTIAAFKMNGYSPYMEHVFVSPTDPLPAPLDGVTPAQLHELAEYAARFHVALIPEQQSFAHMHNTLRLERYAGAAELPHGFLLAPNAPLSLDYLARIVAQELAAVGRPPFFHIGSDETATLGLGSTQSYVAQRGRSNAYAEHIVAMNRLIAPSGARLMLWDDGIENDPAIMKLIPSNAVVVNWHNRWSPRARATGTRSSRRSMPLSSTSGALSMKVRRRRSSGSSKPFGTTMGRRSTKRRGIPSSTPRPRPGSGEMSSRSASPQTFPARFSASTTMSIALTWHRLAKPCACWSRPIIRTAKPTHSFGQTRLIPRPKAKRRRPTCAKFGSGLKRSRRTVISLGRRCMPMPLP
jgi:hypothetical protein